MEGSKKWSTTGISFGTNNVLLSIYLSIYIPGYYPPKGGNQNKARICTPKSYIYTPLTYPYVFIGEHPKDKTKIMFLVYVNE